MYTESDTDEWPFIRRDRDSGHVICKKPLITLSFGIECIIVVSHACSLDHLVGGTKLLRTFPVIAGGDKVEGISHWDVCVYLFCCHSAAGGCQ